MNNHSKIFEKLKAVLEDADLKQLDKNVFAALITFNGKGKIFPSREKICERIGYKRVYSISDSIKRLEGKGYIKTIRQLGISNRYILADFKQSHPKPELKKPKSEEIEPKVYQPLTREQKEKSIRYATAIIYAKILYNRKYEGGDFELIQSLLKLKNGDTEISYVNKCLMLLHVIRNVKDKINHENFRGIITNQYKQSTTSDIKRIFKKPEADFNFIPNSNNIPFTKIKRQI